MYTLYASCKCTHDPFNASNDWAYFQTGDWSGLGDSESYTLINPGGSNSDFVLSELGISPQPS